MRVGNIIRGPGARAPQYIVLAMTPRTLVTQTAYGDVMTFPRSMDHVWRILR